MLNQTGENGVFGGGGGGVLTGASTSASQGGDGGHGLVIITEYCWQ
jgi:hypothetical protein